MSSSLSQYDGWTVEEIVAKNSHELTAMQILNARTYILEQRASHNKEVRRLVTQIEDAHRLGLAVMAAKRAGRKTVRISDLIGGDK